MIKMTMKRRFLIIKQYLILRLIIIPLLTYMLYGHIKISKYNIIRGITIKSIRPMARQ